MKKQVNFRNRQTSLGRVKGVAVLLSLMIVVSSFSGCFSNEKEAAQNLVKTGTATSGNLADYYGTLSQQSAETLNFVRFERIREKKDLEKDELFKGTEAELKAEREALDARAGLATSLKGVYEALGKLIDYDAATEVSGAVDNLRKAIEEVSTKKLSKAAGIDPGVILQKASALIVTWIQLRKFHKNATEAEAVLDGITELFNKESFAYTNIAQDYVEHAYTNAKFFVDNDMATDSAVYQKSFEVFGLQSNPASLSEAVTMLTLDPDEIKDPEALRMKIRKMKENRADLKRASLIRIEKKKEDLNAAAAKAPAGKSQSLVKLKEAHQDFRHGKYKKKEEAQK